MDSDKEQPASGAGSRTSLPGLSIFAVSAMKRTPQNTMVSASEAAPSLASLYESPTKSATPRRISGR